MARNSSKRLHHQVRRCQQKQLENLQASILFGMLTGKCAQRCVCMCSIPSYEDRACEPRSLVHFLERYLLCVLECLAHSSLEFAQAFETSDGCRRFAQALGTNVAWQILENGGEIGRFGVPGGWPAGICMCLAVPLLSLRTSSDFAFVDPQPARR